ncbi:MAG: acetyl-CoA carboxylase, biotin carboxyl carrier protein [Oscillospiraceae bacterium]|jgi:acetyl-CoA carboxylase biotin carboxyl carrier protein|nr:acetyl-CoA carboxylase, biotin carboxyl carrier protein [Oscillospiraceae bacterium]
MDKSDIRELAELMLELELKSIEYTDADGAGVRLTRDTRAPRGARTGRERRREGAGDAREPGEAERDGVVTVPSPMVGIFYCAPGEGQKPYVTLGDAVREGDVLCIIEAMKMMNEITAERDGVIVEICASNKQTVDYGHPLFRLRPN